jgi:aryl-alcohol dehydrogenase-like predicted oxidoreductase
MISEVVCGGDPVRLDNYKQVEMAIEMGLNYLDMAPAYGRGECERAYAKIVSQPSKRDRVFMNTKISGFTGIRNRLYQEIFDGLPSEKKEAIMKRADSMIEQRGVTKPGYFFEYYPGQIRQYEATYRSNAMARDYAHRVDGSAQFRKFMIQSLEQSLKRAQTDHFDLVMCPHGACSPEEVDIPEIFETFAELKKQGKVRFLGVSSHNDPAGVLRAATESGKYDVVMMAYNVCNGGYLEEAIRAAAAKDMGIIAMKVAMAVATQHKQLQPIPEWRIQKVNRIVPGDLKPPLKAYIWALQNPGLTAVISNLWDDDFVRENLSVAGKKVELQPA